MSAEMITSSLLDCAACSGSFEQRNMDYSVEKKHSDVTGSLSMSKFEPDTVNASHVTDNLFNPGNNEMPMSVGHVYDQPLGLVKGAAELMPFHAVPANVASCSTSDGLETVMEDKGDDKISFISKDRKNCEMVGMSVITNGVHRGDTEGHKECNLDSRIKINNSLEDPCYENNELQAPLQEIQPDSVTCNEPIKLAKNKKRNRKLKKLPMSVGHVYDQPLGLVKGVAEPTQFHTVPANVASCAASDCLETVMEDKVDKTSFISEDRKNCEMVGMSVITNGVHGGDTEGDKECNLDSRIKINNSFVEPCYENNELQASLQEIQPDSVTCHELIKLTKNKKHNRKRKKLDVAKPRLKHNKKHMKDTADISDSFEKVKNNSLPSFESFIVEAEEGSGGYATVYRARRKDDGKRFAIKCPRENVHMQRVANEQKMLERLGGRNFIIKYAGSFKSKDSECLVLEHVVHDRPEILKREISISELQWYGFCMFKALAYLHKQGVAHRDIKPGNFLFSRTVNKGYLIDFNLAVDLQQKFAPRAKSSQLSVHGEKSGGTILSKTDQLVRERKQRSEKSQANPEPIINIQRNVVLKRKNYSNSPSKPYPGSGSVLRSQGGDGSGVTSAKDGTSIRTPSGERMREPIPCVGRRELINFVHSTMQTPYQNSVNILASQRKRVSASPVKSESRVIFYPSPMPIHSNGVCITGSGLMKTKDGKHRRDGPCVGTKGFRAPEVLFRSSHQSFKVDVWSAGVTLLYFVLGRAPFGGEPEQNLKEIAKLKGSEELWELAKLHDRESSFPAELLEMRSLASMKVEQWGRVNTKRPGFFQDLPPSLFCLVDKCLTVNPRLRASAEEALRHDFFAPCRAALRRQRRQSMDLEPGGGSDQLL